MSSVIINSLVPGKNVRTVALWQLYLALMPIPGVILGAWLVNKIGRRWTGITGFLGGYVIIGFIIGGCYERLTTHSLPAFVVLYGLLQAYASQLAYYFHILTSFQFRTHGSWSYHRFNLL